MELQTGDKIRRIRDNNFYYSVIIGEIYTVATVYGESFSIVGKGGRWHSRNFEKVNPPKKTGFGEFIKRVEECSK